MDVLIQQFDFDVLLVATSLEQKTKMGEEHKESLWRQKSRHPVKFTQENPNQPVNSIWHVIEKLLYLNFFAVYVWETIWDGEKYESLDVTRHIAASF